MTEETSHPHRSDVPAPSWEAAPVAPPAPSWASAPAPAPAYAPVPTHHAYPAPPAYATMTGGPVGRIRSTGVCMLLMVCTLGFYGLFWYYKTHQEMKAHSGAGLGGGLALLLSFFVGFVMPYVTASEVGNLYRRAGRAAPVSGVTGLWAIPGNLILIGPFIWFIKTNSALNSYWRMHGAA